MAIYIVGNPTPPVVDDVVWTSWANFNLAQNPTNGVNFAAQDYPIWTPNNAVYHSYRPTGSWDGGPCVRILGAQVDQAACGLGNFVNLWRNGSVPIQKISVSHAMRMGPTMVQNWSGADWKYMIFQTNPTLINNPDPGGGERPMVHWAYTDDVNGPGSGPKKLGMSVACGTVGNFVRSPPFAPAYGPTPDTDWFMGAAAGTYNGHPVIGPLEWIHLEIEVISANTSEASGGRIRSIMTRRNGQVFDLSIPWLYDSNWTLGDYVHGLQLLGGYWNQAVTASDADTYYEMTSPIFRINQPGTRGAPLGFVQV